MSDAMSDMLKQEREHENFTDFVNSVIEYLLFPCEMHLNTIREDIKYCRSIPREFKNDTEAVVKWLNLLTSNDNKTWIKWLLKVHYHTEKHEGYLKYKMSYYQKLKSISPLKDKIILELDYGFGFSSVHGEINEFLDVMIDEQKMAKYDGDKYAIILDKNIKNEVIWLRSAIHSEEYTTPYVEERSTIKKQNQERAKEF